MGIYLLLLAFYAYWMCAFNLMTHFYGAVLQQATMAGGMGMCLSAHAAKVVANHALEFLLVRVL